MLMKCLEFIQHRSHISPVLAPNGLDLTVIAGSPFEGISVRRQLMRLCQISTASSMRFSRCNLSWGWLNCKEIGEASSILGSIRRRSSSICFRRLSRCSYPVEWESYLYTSFICIQHGGRFSISIWKMKVFEALSSLPIVVIWYLLGQTWFEGCSPNTSSSSTLWQFQKFLYSA